MKRTLILPALCLLFSGSLAFAQQPQPAPDGQQPPAPITRTHNGGAHMHNPHKQAAMLSRKLNLSPEQTAKLEPILADRALKVAALRANTTLSPQQMHEQMRALHQQERTQLAGVLTPAQQEQMKSMHHGRNRHGQPAAQPAAAA